MPKKAILAGKCNYARGLMITHPDKIYWPIEKYTKEDLFHYYNEVAKILLPYLKNRPVTLRRFPEGIEGETFYQKDTSSLHLPEGTKTVMIEQEKKQMRYLIIQDVATLDYAINLGVIEIHPFLSQIGHLKEPDYLVIDLDPVDIPFENVVETAQTVHELLEEIKMVNLCKTSGGRGLHIFIPLHAKYSYEQARQFGEILAAIVHQRIPAITSLERKPQKRQKKVYLDVYQNNFGQSVVAPYVVRAKPLAPVSTPLKWEEVKKGLDPSAFTIKTVPARLKKIGDIFKPVLGRGVNLQKGLERLESMIS